MLLEYPNPDRCVVGTLGQPGNRLFVIQVSHGSSLTSVAVEKQQVQILGRRIGEIIDQVESLGQSVDAPRWVSDMGPLDAPVDIVFRAGAIGLAFDPQRNSVQLELFSSEMGEADDTDANDTLLVQIWLTPRQAREFSMRAERIVASGRPACPYCGQPLETTGHICPRSNGYRRPLFER